MDLNDRFAQYDVMSEEEVRKEAKSYQEYKLYCQLKV
jgi:glutaredoxin-related protein